MTKKKIDIERIKTDFAKMFSFFYCFSSVFLNTEKSRTILKNDPQKLFQLYTICYRLPLMVLMIIRKKISLHKVQTNKNQ